MIHRQLNAFDWNNLPVEQITLGLDVGPSSIGSAIVSSKRGIVYCGVIVFPEGINRENGRDSLETPAAERTRHRAARKKNERVRWRKYHVLKHLISVGMCPLTDKDLDGWRKDKIYPTHNKEFIDWLKSTPSDNPYADRKAAVEGVVPPYTLGRALYHLAQRRGFRSSRKNADQVCDSSEVDQNDKNTATGVVKSSIKELTQELNRRKLTLGQYFFDLNQNNEKVRGHYTDRDEHYQKEFDKIVEVQGLDPIFADKMRHSLFDQRHPRSQKHLIGKCSLEKEKTRCVMSHPQFEEFRMYECINNIRIVTENGKIPLNDEQRRSACKAFYRKAPHFEFERVRIEIFGKDSDVQLNYNDETTISSCTVSHQMNDALGMDLHKWKADGVSNSGKKVHYNYQTILDAARFFEDGEKLKDFAMEKLGLNEASAEKIASMRIRDGFAAYSLYAIQKILPFLIEGRQLHEAIFLAKLPEVIGLDKFNQHKNAILSGMDEISSSYRDNKNAYMANSNVKVVPLHKRLKSFVKDNWGVTESGWQTLYRPGSAYDRVVNSDMLPPVNMGMINNPLVKRALSKVRRLVNHLRKSGLINGNTTINVELARGVNNRNQRCAIVLYQQRIERERAAAVAEIEALGVKSSDNLILRYLLWKEQNKKCLYTGRTIDVSDVLNAGSAFDVEHTVPRSRSGDDSQINKTLCYAQYNRDVKKGCLPSECPNYTEIKINVSPWLDKVDSLKRQFYAEKKYAQNMPADQADLKSKAMQKSIVTKLQLDYWEKKCSLFAITSENVNTGFMNRQLVDTSIIAKHLVDLLRSVYPKVNCVHGSAVALARKAWGLQNFHDKKSRENHTHHAVDACVIAALNRDAFGKICSALKDDGYDRDRVGMFGNDDSGVEFAKDVTEAVEKIIVKHISDNAKIKNVRKRIELPSGETVISTGKTCSGQYNKDGRYANIGNGQWAIRQPINPETGESFFKSVEDFEKIVDPVVRQKLKEQISKYLSQGIKFKDAMKLPFWMREPSGNRPGIPIKKVRVFSNVKNPRIIGENVCKSKQDRKNHVYVISGEGTNTQMTIWESMKTSKNGVEVRKNIVKVTNLMDWNTPGFVDPKSRNENGKLVGSIAPGYMAIAVENPDEIWSLTPLEMTKRVYTIVKFTKEGRTTLRWHAEARSASDLAKDNEIKSGKPTVDFDKPHPLLRLVPSTLTNNFIFEGIHFDISLSGKIKFRN